MSEVILNNTFLNKIFEIKRSNSKYYLILFFVWPFLAFLIALNNYSDKAAKRVVYAFIIYYGLLFVNNNTGMDSYRYVLDLIRTAQQPFSDFFQIVGGLYSDTTVDIFEPFVTFIISRFTTSAGVFFAVWAAIMGYFYLRSIDLLYNRYHRNISWDALIFLIFFVFIYPVTAIYGIRMPTATWVFFYAAYHVILYRDKRFIWLALSSILIHWSFITVNALLLIYYFAGNRNIIYLPAAIVSFIIPNLFAPFFQLVSSRLGGAIQNRFSGYTNENYVEAMRQSYERTAWFIRIMNDSVFYFYILAIVIIQIFYKDYIKSKYQENLFSFLLLMISFVNFGRVIPTLSGRYQVVFFLFATLFVFLFFIKQGGRKINFITLLGLFPMLIYSAVQFRLGSSSINLWLFSPVFGLPLFLPEISIADILFK